MKSTSHWSLTVGLALAHAVSDLHSSPEWPTLDSILVASLGFAVRFPGEAYSWAMWGCSDDSPDFSSRTSTLHFNLTRIVQWRSRRRVRFKLRWRQRHTLLRADGYSARSDFGAFRANLCRDG